MPHSPHGHRAVNPTPVGGGLTYSEWHLLHIGPWATTATAIPPCEWHPLH